jgi:hypothetical protein
MSPELAPRSGGLLRLATGAQCYSRVLPRLEVADGGAFHLTGSNWRWILLIALAVAGTLAGCGGSTTGPTTSGPATTASPTAAAATPTASTASSVCPTSATVGSALGTTLPNPVGVAGGGGTQLPGGATALVCEYHAPTENVIIEVITNISPSFISQFSVHFPVAYKSVSGVGDQARSFYETLGGGKDNEAVVATKGSTLVSIGATATPASLSQVEALVNQLL